MIPAWLTAALWRILTLVVPIPVIVILAVGGWLYVDRHSAIREAVNDKARDMVAGAEIAALQAKVAAQREIAARSASVAAEALRRRSVAETAHQSLSVRLEALQLENGDLNDDLANLLSRPVGRDCTVRPDFIGRLRGR